MGSEMCIRDSIMLTNLVRMLRSVKAQKATCGLETRPVQVILPLSPKHGTFGNDGFYSESNLALETLFNRWHSESRGNFLTICGAVAARNRGTGLMVVTTLLQKVSRGTPFAPSRSRKWLPTCWVLRPIDRQPLPAGAFVR